MNKKLCKPVIFLFSLSLIISGCNEEAPHFLELDKTALVFDVEGGSQNIAVSSNGVWTVSSGVNWVTVSPQSGERNVTVSITVSENRTLEERKATLIFVGRTVFSNETITVVVEITQKAKILYLELDKTTVAFEAEGGSQDIAVSTNGNWRVVSNTPNWVTVSPRSGERDATVTVTASENRLFVERRTILTFNDRTETVTVEITQEARFIEIDTNILSFGFESGSQSIQVSSNGSWRVFNSPNWVTVSPQFGTGNATIAITVTENGFAGGRANELIFICGTQGTIIATIDITQEIKPFYDNHPQGVVINGVRWATRNVDAPGTFAESPESSGMFYQWNRNIGWSSTNPMINSNGGTFWNSSNQAGSTWTRANDPCPQGWRVPTRAEIQTLGNTNNVISQWTTLNGVSGRTFTDRNTDNTIFLPAVGWRTNTSGVINLAGNRGLYWSSTFGNATYSFYLLFTSIVVIAGSNDLGNRAGGMSVRCVAE